MREEDYIKHQLQLIRVEKESLLQQLEKSKKDVFKLEEVYKTSHNQFILDMLHTIEHYPDSYLDTIAEIFEDTQNRNQGRTFRIGGNIFNE